MRTAADRLLMWAPRILALLVVAFLSSFALDAVEHEGGFGQVLTAFGIHLLPSFALVAVVALAWHRPWVGGWLFGVAGLGYALSTGRAHLDWIAVISGPLLLTAMLYLLSWILDRQQPARAGH